MRRISKKMDDHLWNQAFGDLPKKTQDSLRPSIQGIERIVGLRKGEAKHKALEKAKMPNGQKRHSLDISKIDEKGKKFGWGTFHK